MWRGESRLSLTLQITRSRHFRPQFLWLFQFPPFKLWTQTCIIIDVSLSRKLLFTNVINSKWQIYPLLKKAKKWKNFSNPTSFLCVCVYMHILILQFFKNFIFIFDPLSSVLLLQFSYYYAELPSLYIFMIYIYIFIKLSRNRVQI